MSALRLGDEAPNFTAQTTEGEINFHDWLGDSWGVLFSHPADYTPVCTTELGTVAKYIIHLVQCCYKNRSTVRSIHKRRYDKYADMAHKCAP